MDYEALIFSADAGSPMINNHFLKKPRLGQPQSLLLRLRLAFSAFLARFSIAFQVSWGYHPLTILEDIS